MSTLERLLTIEISVKRHSRKISANELPSINNLSKGVTLQSPSVESQEAYLSKKGVLTTSSIASNYGTEFELRLLMLFLWRGIANENQYLSFRLTPEMEEAEKVDDIVFQYKTKDSSGIEKWKFRFLQAKHILHPNTNKITDKRLQSDKDSEYFSLQKYLHSYLRIKQKIQEDSVYSIFTGSEIEDVIICTNTDFSSENMKNSYFDRIDIEQDKIFKIGKFLNQKKKASILKFKEDQGEYKANKIIKELMPILEKTSDFTRLIEKLANYVLNNESKQKEQEKLKDIFKIYRYTIAKEVINVDEGKFRDEFIKENSSNEIKGFKDAFKKEVIRRQTLEEIKHNLPNDDRKLTQLADKLVNCVLNKETIPFEDSYIALAREKIINIENGQLHNLFISDRELSESGKKLKKLFKKGIKLGNDKFKNTKLRLSLDFGQVKLDIRGAQSEFPSDVTELAELANRLIEHLAKDIELTSSEKYHVALAREVINVKTCKLYEEFITDQELSEQGKKLKKYFKKKIKIKRKEIKKVVFENFKNLKDVLPKKGPELKKLSKELDENFGDGKELIENPILKKYYLALSANIIDTAGKQLREEFVKGEDSSTKDLSVSLDKLQTTFLDSILAIKLARLDEGVFWKDIANKRIDISSDFEGVFKPKQNPTIEDVERLSEKMANLIKDNIVNIDRQSDAILNKNLDSLSGYVFIKRYGKIHFSTKFLKGTFLQEDKLPADFIKDVKNFRENLMDKLGGEEKFKKIRCEFIIKDFETCEERDLDKKLPALPKKEEVEEFLDKFKFVINYPDKDELVRLIESDVRAKYKLNDGKSYFNHFEMKVRKWKGNKKWVETGVINFYTRDKATGLFQKIEEELESQALMSATPKYYAEIENIKINFERDIIGLSNFLETDEDRILILPKEGLLLSHIKVCRIFKNIQEDLNQIEQNVENAAIKYLNSVSNAEKMRQYTNKGGHIFLHLRELVGTGFSSSIIESFSKSFNLLVIECDASPDEEETQKLVGMLASILEKKINKKIILISQKDSYLGKAFNESLSKQYVDKSTQFNDLTSDSKKWLIEKESFVFQGKQEKTNLKELIEIKDPSRLSSEDLQRLDEVVTESALVELIDRDKIVLGSAPLGFSDPGSAHYFSFTEINLERLKLALTENPNDVFAFAAGDAEEIQKLIAPNERTLLRRFADLEQDQLITRFILLEPDKKRSQFKQLCREDTGNQIKKAIHLIEQQRNEWILAATYTRDIYLDRHFYHILIKDTVKNILNEEQATDFIVFSGIDEEELFKLLKEKGNSKENLKIENLKRNSFSSRIEGEAKSAFERAYKNPRNAQKGIHWLKGVKIEANYQFHWYCSYGKVGKLRQHRDEVASQKRLLTETTLVEQTTRIGVIADEPGMGKSTTLAYLSEHMMKEKQLPWIIKIDLNKCQRLLALNPVKTKTDVVNLLSRMDPGLQKNALSQKILEHHLQRPGQVILLFDGFDEIKKVDQSESRSKLNEIQEIAIKLFEFLKKETCVKFWVTTRPHLQTTLEERLSVLNYEFEPLNQPKQIEFLSQFWTHTLKLIVGPMREQCLKGYAQQLIDCFEQSIRTHDEGGKPFISIPLRARMLAEVFRDRVKEAYQKREKVLFQSAEKLTIGDLYQRFIEQKYVIYLNEKISVAKNLDTESKLYLEKGYTKAYGLLALQELFGRRDVALFTADNKENFSLDTLERIGLVRGSDDQVAFIHRTFAEYFAATWLVSHEKNLDVRNFLRAQIFKRNSEVVRRFFDHLVMQDLLLHRAVLEDNVSIAKELLSKNANIDTIDSLGRTVLHVAAQEGRYEIIQLLWEAGDDGLKKDHFGRTPLHYAARYGHAIVVNDLLAHHIDMDLDDHIFRTPLHFGVEIGPSIFREPEYAQSKLMALVNEQDQAGQSSLNYAADNEHWRVACALLLHGADSRVLTEENKNKLLSYAAEETHATNAKYYHALRPIVGFLSIQVPDTVHGYHEDYGYPRLLSYFFEYGHTKVIDALLGSIADPERRKRIANHKDKNLLPLRRICENDHFRDADYLKIVSYLFNSTRRHGIEIDLEGTNCILLAAAGKGYLKTFRYLVEQEKAEVAHMNSTGYTAIYVAAHNNHLPIVKYLWENHRESIIDQDGLTALHFAVASGSLQIICYLCDHGANIDMKNQDGRTSLHYAARRGHIKVTEYLIEKQMANFNLIDQRGKTALDFAAENDQWDITEYLVEKGTHIQRGSPFIRNIAEFFRSQHTFELNLVDQNGMPRLHRAIRSGEVRWVNFLIQRGSNVNSRDRADKTPLHWAADPTLGNTEIVELLLQQGAKYDVIDATQRTPLDLSRSDSRWPLSKTTWLLQLIDSLFRSQTLMQHLKKKLLKEKSQVLKWGPYGLWYPDAYDRSPMLFILNARNVKDKTLLHRAVDTNDLAAVECLLRFNRDYLALKNQNNYDHVKYYKIIDINVQDDQGDTPLHRAAQQGHSEIVSLLLKEGVIFNMINRRKNTPHSLAQNEKHPAIMQCLQSIQDLFKAIKEGNLLDVAQDNPHDIYVHARVRDGRTLLHWAAQKGQVEIIQWLLDKGADINAVNSQHGTPLHDAAAENQVAVIRLLLHQGATFNAKNKQGHTPLDLVQNQDISLLKMVNQLFSDAQANRPAAMIETLRSLDTHFDNLSAVTHARDAQGHTLLHWAAQEDYFTVVLYLLKNGAVYDVKNKQNRMPRSLAHHQEIVDLLRLVEEWFNDDNKPLTFSLKEVANDSDKLTVIKKCTQ